MTQQNALYLSYLSRICSAAKLQWDFNGCPCLHVSLPMIRYLPTWGYDRIQGALANLRYAISDTTVGNILKQHGIEPAPERKRQTTWKTFIQAHWDVMAAIDFTTIKTWTKSGLATFYLLRCRCTKIHF